MNRYVRYITSLVLCLAFVALILTLKQEKLMLELDTQEIQTKSKPHADEAIEITPIAQDSMQLPADSSISFMIYNPIEKKLYSP